MYADEQNRLQKYVEEYEGNVRETDETSEILFKMNEHVKHVNADLSKYLEMEHSMYDFVRAHSQLPEIINSF